MITIGNVLFCIIGVFIGASIMYFFEVYMDWREDREAEKRAETEEFKRRHRNESKTAKLIPVSFGEYVNGKEYKMRCWKCSRCEWFTMDSLRETCDGCGAYFEHITKEDKA